MKKILFLSLFSLLTFFKADESQAKIPCQNCTLVGAPVYLALPPMRDLTDFFSYAGMPEKKVEESASLILNMFDRMNYRTPMGNSFVFIFSMLRGLEQMGLKSVTRAQLIYLSEKYRDQLPPADYLALNGIYKQIEALNFLRDSQGQLMVVLKTVGNRPIKLTSRELPAGDEGGRAMLEEYIESLNIQNGSTLVFKDQRASSLKIQKNQKQKLTAQEIEAFTRASTVEILGIKLIINAPVIGNVEVTPKKIDLDIDHPTAAKADVTFKKLIWYTHTFDFDY